MNRAAVVTIVLAVVAAEAILLITDTGPDVVLVAAVVTLFGVSIWFPTSLSGVVARPAPAPTPLEPGTAFPDLRTTTLRQALATGDTDPRHAERIRQQLILIVDDELLAEHGIDRAADPEAASAVLDPDLHRFVTEPDTAATLTPAGLSRTITLIEQL